MLAYAQELVYTLKELMPTQYQKDNFDAMLGLFLSAQGHPLPEHSKTKSPSALSRFLNINPWSTRDMIRIVRSDVLETVLKVSSASGKGRRPFLQVIIDLTTLEKRGKFKEFGDLIRVYNGKRRWQIEGWFKTAKHRFGLHRFGQGTMLLYISLAHPFSDCLPHSSLDLSPNSVPITA